MGDIKVYQTRQFKNQKKKLKKNQIKELDQAIKMLIENPELGQQKSGDLANIWVYKFNLIRQQYLLAYMWDEASRTFIALGLHENFYRDLKRSVND